MAIKNIIESDKSNTGPKLIIDPMITKLQKIILNIFSDKEDFPIDFSANQNILSFALIAKAQYEFKDFGGIFAYATFEQCKTFSSNKANSLHISPSIGLGAGVFINLK